MARWLRQILVACLAVALIAGGVSPWPMPDRSAHAGPLAGPLHATSAVVADDAMPCHGMAMPCEDAAANDAAPPADHQAPACPNMMACCLATVPGLPSAATVGIGAPVTAGTVLRLALQRAGDGHIPSPLPKIPRA
jgi:hypothetical protein